MSNMQLITGDITDHSFKIMLLHLSYSVFTYLCFIHVLPVNLQEKKKTKVLKH